VSSAVPIKTPGNDESNYGGIRFTARTDVDKVNRVVTVSDFTLKKQNFPTVANNSVASPSTTRRVAGYQRTVGARQQSARGARSHQIGGRQE